MIQETRLRIVDNSGGKQAKLIRKGLVRVTMVYPSRKVKKGQIFQSFLICSKKGKTRKTGITYKLYSNEVILLKANSPVATRIYRPLPLEVKFKGFSKLLSISNSIY